MKQGILYLLSGVGYAELLAVSLFTLRKHYSGAVHVFVTDDASEAAVNRMQADASITVSRIPLPSVRRHHSYCVKATLPALSPFKRSVFLDADTLVCGDIGELFGSCLAVTRFSDWVTTGKTISKRIRQWGGGSKWGSMSPAVDGLIAHALAESRPAVNTGIFGFHRDCPILPQWEALTLAGWQRSFTDELAMQLLWEHQPGARIFDDRWNASPVYSAGRQDVRVWHLHGRAHARKDAGRALWLPVFEEAISVNFAGLVDWSGDFDAAVKLMRSGQHAAA